MNRREFLHAAPLALAQAGEPPDVVFDGSAPGDPIRPLHGVNGGPLAAGGLLDLSPRWTEAAFPLARLHDSHWPNPDVVDVHAVFPDPAADPSRPDSYDFERTDEYVKAVHACGAAVVYRLGESIEHQKAKRRARPPKDPDRWAAVCVGIVRHFTEGWANGLKLPIRYWEIWNEPDNRPSCWTGTDEDYFRLYVKAAVALRKRFPAVKIGGPGLGNSGDLKGDRLEPTPFLKAFLSRCKKDHTPLDFLSWHCYAREADELARRARGMRAVLDGAGFGKAESHLNEWNFLPDGKWDGIKAKDAEARERWYARLTGPEGAAFVAAALTLLQDAPLDAACYFTAEAPGMGLFSQHGLPSTAFAAFLAFKAVARLPRLPVKGPLPRGVTALAGASTKVQVLLARTGGKDGPVTVTLRPPRWAGATRYEILVPEAGGRLRKAGEGKAAGSTVRVDLGRVCLLRMGPGGDG